jgi:transcription antitermination factor NusG
MFSTVDHNHSELLPSRNDQNELLPLPDANLPERASHANIPEQPAYKECWYVVYTRARHEKCVAEQCAERGMHAFLPLYAVQRQWKQRRAEVLLPLFPSYVFVRIPLVDRLRVLNLCGALFLVSFNGAPAVVPDPEIDALRRAISLGRAEPHVYLHSGKRVRVTAGPLAGLEGIIVKIRNRVQVIVSFEWMTRSVAISLDAADVATIH